MKAKTRYSSKGDVRVCMRVVVDVVGLVVMGEIKERINIFC